METSSDATGSSATISSGLTAMLRAMAMPAGNHTDEFRFRAPHYAALTAVTRACSLLHLAGLVAAVSVAAVRKRKQTENS